MTYKRLEDHGFYQVITDGIITVRIDYYHPESVVIWYSCEFDDMEWQTTPFYAYNFESCVDAIEGVNEWLDGGC